MRIPGALVRLGVSVAVISAVTITGAYASADPATTASSASAARVKLLSSPYGPMLFTGGGQALYLFKKDGRRKSRCYGACAAAWPPLKTGGAPIARGQVRQDLLGTTRRRGGARQVTYNGHPLYTYAHEGRRQVLCHNVFANGGLWLAVRRNGKPVAH